MSGSSPSASGLLRAMDHHIRGASAPGERDLADTLAAFVRAKCTMSRQEIESRIGELAKQESGIESLSLMSEQEEANHTLRQERSRVTRIEKAMAALRGDGSKNFLHRWYRWGTLKLDLREARNALEAAHTRFKSSEVFAARRERIARHNDAVREQQGRLPELSQALAAERLRKEQLDTFIATIADALTSVARGSWKSAEFDKDLARVAIHLRDGDFRGATAAATHLRFQRRPPDSVYAAWKQEADTLLSSATASRFGYSASSKYTLLAQHSAHLGVVNLAPSARALVDCFDHPADKWQALSEQLTSPGNLSVEPLWVIYWAMFQFSQQTANVLY